MHRPRGGAAVLTSVRQAWVPRVLNVALAVFLLAMMSPVLTRFGGHSRLIQVFLVVAVLPVVLVALLCLASAVRPGSLGRAARRARRSR